MASGFSPEVNVELATELIVSFTLPGVRTIMSSSFAGDAKQLEQTDWHRERWSIRVDARNAVQTCQALQKVTEEIVRVLQRSTAR